MVLRVYSESFAILALPVKDRVLITDPIDEAGLALMAASAELVRAPDSAPDTVRRLAADCDAVMIRSRLPDDIFTVAPRLRAVAVHGTGTDLVPMDAANAHGVLVSNVPGGNAQSVAEFCVMGMLMLSRNIGKITESLRRDTFDAARALAAPALELDGGTVGIVGLGHIGARVANICGKGFGMRVLGNQRSMDRLPAGVEGATLDALLAQSDYVVLACPLNPQTQHLMNRERLTHMKPSAFLVNVGRGPVIEEAALVEALRAGRPAGAMLDVYEHYRLEPGNPLLMLDNVILTPHLAGATRQARRRVSLIAAEEILRMLAGERPRSYVNPDSWSKHAKRRPQDR
jgi:D-3-phosphoglycerate dehydrogenase